MNTIKKTILANHILRKNISFLCASIILAMPAFLIGSCAKENDTEVYSEDNYILKTKAPAGTVEDFFVSDRDISNYLSFKSLDGLSRNEKTTVKEIIPIKWEDDICLYVVQYEKGYEVISADKRSPLPLMRDEEGTFDSLSEDTPIGFHLYTLAEDISLSLYKNVSFGEPDPETLDNIESSLLFWKLIGADYQTIKEKTTKTKVLPDTMILEPNSGHWELISTTTQTEVYDTSAHLTTTWWHQYYPFNEYCPYYSSIGLDRCPAGCVAIAGAQMLYFLHYKIGVPEQSPTTGSCTGYVHPNLPGETVYTQSFGNYSSNTWNNMLASYDSPSTRYAAKLIGDIGKKVNMVYSNGPEGSCATMESLRDDAFYAYGIQCTTMNYYNGNFLKGSLAGGYPVLCSGFNWDINEMGDTTNIIGHAFLVDRYIRFRTKITFTYEWIFDDPGQSPGYQIIKNTVVYDAPYITMYQMNWGYGYEYNYNDVWCNLNGMWQYGDWAFVHNRKMFYGFRALDE